MISFVSGRSVRARPRISKGKRKREREREREEKSLSLADGGRQMANEEEREREVWKGNEVEYPTNSDRRRTRLDRDSMDLW